jgi:hypothetical protein
MLVLASDCEAEGLELRGDLRERLRRITDEAVEDNERARRQMAAEHMLARRVRNMLRLDDDRYLDTSPVSHAEYQLFIDEKRAQGEFRQPDHWESYDFPKGTGKLPVVGIRKSDAKAFCIWLNERNRGGWSYFLPEQKELNALAAKTVEWEHLSFFTSDPKHDIQNLRGDKVVERLRYDLAALPGEELFRPRLRFRLRRVCQRVVLFLFWAQLRQVQGALGDSQVDLANVLGLTSANPLDRELRCAGDLLRNLSRDITRNLDLDISRYPALDLSDFFHRALDGMRSLDIYDRVKNAAEGLQVARFDVNASNLKLGLDSTYPAELRKLARAHELTLDDVYLVLSATMLNWLCVSESRAEGGILATEALWLIRTREKRNENWHRTAAAVN